MRPKIRFLALIAILVLSMLITVGCGVDTSTLAGSASGINSTEKEQAEPGSGDSESDEWTDFEELIEDEEAVSEDADEVLVWVSKTGECYHSDSSCSRMRNPWQVPLSEAEENGRRPCQKCY